MLQRILGGLTVALLALSFGANNAYAGPLEDSLAGPAEHDACTGEFASLREAAVARGKLVKSASERHAAPGEACELIGNYARSEIEMIRYLEANPAKCGYHPQVVEQLKASHKYTETMLTKVCAAARQAQVSGPAGPVGDFDHTGAPPIAR
jgi:hypothetical protein